MVAGKTRNNFLRFSFWHTLCASDGAATW